MGFQLLPISMTLNDRNATTLTLYSISHIRRNEML